MGVMIHDLISHHCMDPLISQPCAKVGKNMETLADLYGKKQSQ